MLPEIFKVNWKIMPRSALHEAARAYAAFGWPIFPIAAGTKNPPLTAHGFKDASKDEAQIDAWWSRWPTANIGLSCGAANIGVIDVDRIAALADLPSLPATFAVATPRGGQHHYFQGNCRSSVSRLAAGIDTRGTGGYTLLPPSIVDGKRYEEISDAELAPLPEWVNERLVVASTPRQSPEEIIPNSPELLEKARNFLLEEITLGHLAISGTPGDTPAYIMACKLGDIGITRTNVLTLMAEIWNPHCVPPYEDEYLAFKVRNAFTYRENGLGAGLSGEPPRQLVNMEVYVKPENVNTKVGNPPKRFEVLWEAQQDTLPEPRWLIQNVLPDRTTAALFGVSGHHKTTLALDLALSLAAGEPTAFKTTPTRTAWTAYGALEGKDGIARFRRPAWRQHRGIDRPIRFGLVNAPRMAREGELTAFVEELKHASDEAGGPPALIVIDTMLKAMVGWKADELGSSFYIDCCEQLMDVFDCTVLSIAHPGKDVARGVLGSQNFINGIDTHLRVQFDEGSSVLTFTAAQHKDFGRPIVPYYFDVIKVGPGMVLRDKPREEALRALQKHAVLSPARVGEALSKLGAIKDGDPIRTRVLAMEITPRLATDDDEAYEKALRKNEKALRASAQGLLAAYWLGGDQWKIPTLDS